MSYSALFQIHSRDLTSEAEVEMRLLAPLFEFLGYKKTSIIPKKSLPSLSISSGRKKTVVTPDFILLGKNKNAKVIVEAKSPKESVQEAWDQTASYALAYNKDKPDGEKVRWLLISNGYITSLYQADSGRPIVTLNFSDFASGSPPYVSLRSYIKHISDDEVITGGLPFSVISPSELNSLFEKCHDLVWKKEKLNPTDAFFEFCKFIFLKIRFDKERVQYGNKFNSYELPMTLDWLDAQKATHKHPVRDALFVQLRDSLEVEIKNLTKRRIFEQGETFRLSAETTRELIKKFQNINLSSIDEDLNGRMFEVFLNSAVRGKELGQYFTPRQLVDFMTRIGLESKGNDVKNPPKVIDASCGTSGFLIEVMAYLLSKVRGESRFSEYEKQSIISVIANESLFGIEANERVSRIARINMYLHGDGGSHIFHGDGLDNNPQPTDDMSDERMHEVLDHQSKIRNDDFDLALTNPPFSMSYSSSNEDEERILRQLVIANGEQTVKSNVLFLQRYYDILKPNGELLIVLDDTVLNGSTHTEIRKWLLDKFLLLGVHSMPFNAFFKAKANIKTSVLHLRKKIDNEKQGHVFMSISNNIGHDNALKDTPERNNLNEILNMYMEWKRTGKLETLIVENQDPFENLECPEQVWLVEPQKLSYERIDSFYYAPDLHSTWSEIRKMSDKGLVEIKSGNDFILASKMTAAEKSKLVKDKTPLRYIEISDVTRYGLITNYITDTLDNLPTRGQYKVKTGDILMAINNSSRGTVVLVPEAFDGTICTSGFYVIRPRNAEEAHLLWYSLRSEACRKQIYYLAQTASQPELKKDAWEKDFIVPFPIGETRKLAIKESKEFQSHLSALTDADKYRWNK